MLTGLEDADKLYSLSSCKAVPVTEANHPGETCATNSVGNARASS